MINVALFGFGRIGQMHAEKQTYIKSLNQPPLKMVLRGRYLLVILRLSKIALIKLELHRFLID